MPHVLRVKAKPGVLVTDQRALPARRFIGRDHAPPKDGPGLALGHIAPGLYDPGKLHLGEPVDVDELFPIKDGEHELVFHVDAKHPHVAHKERGHHKHIKDAIAAGDLLPADEHTAKHCGVKFEAPAKAEAEHDAPEHDEEHAQ